jgi:hypothetical protein
MPLLAGTPRQLHDHKHIRKTPHCIAVPKDCMEGPRPHELHFLRFAGFWNELLIVSGLQKIG